MTKFLAFEETEETYSVVIDGLTKAEADRIKAEFPTAVICVG